MHALSSLALSHSRPSHPSRPSSLSSLVTLNGEMPKGAKPTPKPRKSTAAKEGPPAALARDDEKDSKEKAPENRDHVLALVSLEGLPLPSEDTEEAVVQLLNIKYEMLAEVFANYCKQSPLADCKSVGQATSLKLVGFKKLVKDAGLACKFIIANRPQEAAVTDRAIPVAIFESEEAVKVHYLRRWLKDRSLSADDIDTAIAGVRAVAGG